MSETSTQQRAIDSYEAYKAYKQRIALFPQEDVETYEQWLEHERELLLGDKTALRAENAALKQERDGYKAALKALRFYELNLK